MRLLVALLLVAIPGCTRANPAFGAGEGDDGESGRTSDPSGSSSSDSLSSSVGTLESTATDAQSTGGQDASDSLTGADTLEPSRDCCAKHAVPGCDDAEVEQCVCEALDYCCANAWDDTCVEQARHCNGGCGLTSDSLTGGTGTSSTTDGTTTGNSGDGGGDQGGSGSTTGGVSMSACCAAADALGCGSDPIVESCVCGEHPECCETAWDDNCVGYATECGLQC